MYGNGEAFQLHAVHQYCKSCENLLSGTESHVHCVCEIQGSYDGNDRSSKLCGKKYHSFVTVGIVTRAAIFYGKAFDMYYFKIGIMVFDEVFQLLSIYCSFCQLNRPSSSYCQKIVVTRGIRLQNIQTSSCCCLIHIDISDKNLA